MKPEQQKLLEQARQSLDAARLLDRAGHHGFAASRAYYAMFYCVEALLAGRGLAFSKHGAVLGAFAEHFVRTGVVPRPQHSALVRAMEIARLQDRPDAPVEPARDGSAQLKYQPQRDP